MRLENFAKNFPIIITTNSGDYKPVNEAKRLLEWARPPPGRIRLRLGWCSVGDSGKYFERTYLLLLGKQPLYGFNL